MKRADMRGLTYTWFRAVIEVIGGHMRLALLYHIGEPVRWA